MPVLINDLKERGYFKVRVELGNAFNAEDPEEAELAEMWGEAFIEVRELDAVEAANLNDDPKAMMTNLAQFIVEHNFYQDDEGKKKASKEQVADQIRRSSTVFNYVMDQWMHHLPLVKRSAANSAK